MDPWWSFAVEAQAIDRVHRMGQTEEVHVTRFVVEGSIEEKMLKVRCHHFRLGLHLWPGMSRTNCCPL
jgi:SNF2 family DNA or RNA helicase